MKQLRSVGAALAAVAILAAGALGAVSYGQAYNLHRGFAAVVQLPRAGTGRLLDIRFRSAALHRRAGYMVYLPPGYSPAKRYPVDYLLHGMPGQPHVFVTIANLDVRLDNLIAEHKTKPMILVYPDGRIGGSVLSDSEWANTPAGRFENYVLDVVHDVDTRFSTVPHRQDRVIAGFSAGAYGALNIALHHLSEFTSVQVWSGYFTQTRSGVFAHASPAALAYNSPYRDVRRSAPQIRHDGLRVYMFVGRDDESSAQLLPMVARLRAAGARVGDTIYPGGHDWGVWYPRLNQMLVLASHDLGRLPTLGRGPRPLGPARLVRARTSPSAAAGHHHESGLALMAALALAIIAGAVINVGFVVQQRALRLHERGDHATLVGALRNRGWLAGQLIGWCGFAGQIVAVALAPLTLVQACAAGSLALSVPLAARLFQVRVGRRQMGAIAAVALCLFVLPIGYVAHHRQVTPGVLAAAALIGGAAAALLASRGRGRARALAAGISYGIADAAIKAIALAVHRHGLGGLLQGWTVLAAVATFGGFVSFQSALTRTHAVTAISLMSALATLTATGIGLLAFGESLGAAPGFRVAHVLAIAVVLGCVPILARAHQAAAPDPQLDERAGTGISPARRRAGRVLSTAAGLGAVPVTLGASVVCVGLLYAMRQAGWLALGPRVDDSLPLLQLAGFAGQPALRVAVCSLLTGASLGILLAPMRLSRRVTVVGLLSTFALLVASDASFALTHNLRFTQILPVHAPGLGPWLQALLLTVGCALHDLRPTRQGTPRVGATAPSTAPRLAAGHHPTVDGLSLPVPRLGDLMRQPTENEPVHGLAGSERPA